MGVSTNEYRLRKRKSSADVVINNVDNDDDNDDDIIFLHETTCDTNRSKHRKLQLCETMCIEVRSGEMLSDMTINYASLLLHRQFPDMKGLEDTELVSRLMTSSHTGEFMQILFAESHWILATGCDGMTSNENIRVFDSNNHGGKLTESFLDQIRCLRKGEEEQGLNVSVQSVQQQKNGTDCGVWVLCFAVDVAHRLNPAERHYNPNKLRSHLHQCLESGKFVPFPTFERKRNVKRCEKYSFNVIKGSGEGVPQNISNVDEKVAVIQNDFDDEELACLDASTEVHAEISSIQPTKSSSLDQKQKVEAKLRILNVDCGKCKCCKNMKKFGGTGSWKMKCMFKV